MRNFQTLDHVDIDTKTGILQVSSAAEAAGSPQLSLRREGEYLTISASYGPLEISLRPRFQDVVWTFGRLQAVEGLQTSRQIGTGNAYLAVGINKEQTMLLRPTIVGDATGHVSFNLRLTGDARQKVFDWLGVAATNPQG